MLAADARLRLALVSDLDRGPLASGPLRGLHDEAQDDLAVAGLDRYRVLAS